MSDSTETPQMLDDSRRRSLYAALGVAAAEPETRPAVFSEVSAEYAALGSGCGLVDRLAGDLLSVVGEDSLRFLNGFVTCDLADLGEGSTVYGFVTSAQGKILADLWALAAGDGFRLELPAGGGEAIREHLLKYRIADRVEIEAESRWLPVTLVGPRAADVVAQAVGGPIDALEPGRGRGVAIGSAEAHLVRERRWGAEVLSLWLPGTRAIDVVTGLISGESRARPIGDEALDAFRIENGAPLFGVDFGPDHLPQETGLDEALSFTKGCYLGQEVVARIHYRGKVNRRLCGLVLDGDEPVREPLEVLFGDRPAGTLGRAVLSPRHALVLGLTVLHARVAAGERVALGAERQAEVVELPFALP